MITAIDGTAGVGKTTLAVHWAHQVQHRFPDGTLYVNLRGYGPGQPATPAEVLDGFIRALGCPPQRIPIDLEAQSALYRTLLARRRVLIVLDNANTAQQVRPLLPGSVGCVVLITSRASLTGLVVSAAATRVTLDLLTSSEALSLVRGILGADRVAAERQAVTDLIQLCARLPLALRIAATYAACRPHYAITDVVAEMDADRARLDALSTLGDDPTSVRAVFDWSYRRLNTSQARLFRRLGLHPGHEISLHAAAAVAHIDLTETRRLLDALTDAHLLQAVARDRYRLHDLLRAYAADRAEHEDPDEDRDQARRTLLEWYAHHSATARRVLHPASTDWYQALTLEINADPQIAFVHPEQSVRWIDTEQTNLIAAARHANDHNLPNIAFLISHTAMPVIFMVGESNAAFDIAQLGLAAARRIGDGHSEHDALLDLANMQHYVGQTAEAFAAQHEALALARALGERWFEAGALNDLGRGCLRQGRHAEAIDFLRSALPLSPGAQHGRLEGVIEANLGAAHNGLSQYEQALLHAERGLTLCQQAGDRTNEAHALGQIAQARQGMGAHAEVIDLCERAVNIGRDHTHPSHKAEILETLGVSLQHTGDIKQAIARWREALDIFVKFADPRTAELRARLHALQTMNPNLSMNSKHSSEKHIEANIPGPKPG